MLQNVDYYMQTKDVYCRSPVFLEIQTFHNSMLG